MFTILHYGNQFLYNIEFEEAKNYLKCCSEFYPRANMELAYIPLLIQNFTGDFQQRDKSMEILNKVDAQLCKIYKKNHYLELGKKMQQIYQETSFSNPLLQSRGKLLTQMTDSELLLNYELDCKMVQGESWLLRAIIQFGNKSYFKAAYNLRNSWKTLKSCYTKLKKYYKVNGIVDEQEFVEEGEEQIEEDEDEGDEEENHVEIHAEIQDLIKGYMGIFYYFFSFVPPFFMKLLGAVFGFVENRNKGLEYLTLLSQYKGFKAPIAMAGLGIHYLFVANSFTNFPTQVTKVQPFIDYLCTTYPKGFPFLNFQALYYRKTGNVEEATQVLQKAIQYAKQGNWTPCNILNDFAVCCVLKGEYETAIPTLKQLLEIESYEGKIYAALELVVCYNHLKRIEEANETALQIPNLISKKVRIGEDIENAVSFIMNSVDEENTHIAMELFGLEFLFLGNDMKYLEENHVERFFKRVEELELQMKEWKQVDMLAAILCIKSHLFKTKKMITEATTTLEEAMTYAKKAKKSKQWVPYCLHEKGELLYLSKQKKEALQCIKQALECSHYPFEELLKPRLKSTFASLTQELKSASIH